MKFVHTIKCLSVSLVLPALCPQLTSAAVLGTTCAEINGESAQSYHPTNFPMGEVFTVVLEPGDVLTITDSATGTESGLVFPATPSNVTVTSNGSTVVASGPAPFTFTMPDPGWPGGMAEVSVVGTDTSIPFAALISCTSGDGPPPPPPPVSEIDIVPLVTGLAQSSHDAMASGTRLALQRHRGGNAAHVTRNTAFLGTRNQEGGTAAWAYLTASRFSGDVDGNAQNLIAGADFVTGSDLYIGAMLGYGQLDATYGGVAQEGRGFSLGLYGGQNRENISWDAFIAWARPDYETGGENFSTTRLSFGASVEGILPGKNGALFPFARLSAWEEDVPTWTGGSAQDIRRATATIGARQEWHLADSDIRPWASFAIDFTSRKSGLRGSESFVAPKLGLGLTYELENQGVFSLAIDAGWLEKDTRNIGITLGYSVNF